MKKVIVDLSVNKLYILVDKTQCVFYFVYFLHYWLFGKECAFILMFRLLRRILKQFRINIAGQLGG